MELHNVGAALYTLPRLQAEGWSQFRGTGDIRWPIAAYSISLDDYLALGLSAAQFLALFAYIGAVCGTAHSRFPSCAHPLPHPPPAKDHCTPPYDPSFQAVARSISKQLYITFTHCDSRNIGPELPRKVKVHIPTPAAMLKLLDAIGTPIAHFHSQLSHTHLEPIALLEALTNCVGSKMANDIHQHFLASHSDPSRISAVHCTVIYPIHNDENGRPLLQWKEETGLEGLAVFIRDDSGTWSSLTHYGVRDGPHASQWTRDAFAWNVSSMEALGTLFQVAQHGSGILSLPEEAARKIYCLAKPQVLERRQYSLF